MKTIKLSEIKLNDGTHGLPKNPRFIRDERFRALCDSIRDNPEYMPARPIIVDEAGVILGGNMRFRGCRELKMADVPASWVMRVEGWPVEKKRRFILMDNQGFGEDDTDALVNDWAFQELIAAGYDPDKLEDFTKQQGSADPREDDAEVRDDQAQKLQDKWQTAPGQLWTAGAHRILCGDATDPACWMRLMHGEKAVLCNTDPPYGVSYAKDQGRMIKGDSKREDDLLSTLLAPSLKLAVAHTTPDASFYVWHATKTRRDFEEAIDVAGLSEKQYITWVKDALVMGRADYHWQTEPAFYCQKCGHSCRWLGDRKQTTVWRVRPPSPAQLSASIANGVRLSDGDSKQLYLAATAPKNRKTRLIRLGHGEAFYVQNEHTTDAWEIARDPAKERLHPTQKPVKLFEIPIRNHTAEGDLIVEPFAGGGGQFIAAQRTGRRCFGMDLDSKYVAVVLERLAAEGLTPEKQEDKDDETTARKISRKTKKRG